MDFVLTGGDWPVFFKSTIEQLSWYPQVWSPTNGNGLGQNISFVLGYKTFFNVQAKFYTEILNLHWSIAEKFIFFIPFWLLALTNSYFLGKYFLKDKFFAILSSIIFATNTYALMLIGGGQMGVAIAYALSPLAILLFLNLLDSLSVRRTVITAVVFALLLCIDPRVAAIVSLIAGIFFIFQFSIKKLLFIAITFLLAVAINFFWILPFIVSGTSSLSDAYTKTDILYFLSFAKIENALGLLHPNWPENVFGKVGFMRSEFLILAIIAFSSFLFRTDKKIKILGFIALLGAFFSKGVNDPFGVIYYFLSNNIPLFTMFRDSTKWYIMLCISYSILIPFALYSFANLLTSSKKFSKKIGSFTLFTYNFKFRKKLVLTVFLFFWAVTIRQLFFGELTGTFRAKDVPIEYLELEDEISSDNEFYRILWIPQLSRFGYFSATHPAVNSYDIITSHDLKPTIEYLRSKKGQNFIKEKGIKYLIVPLDPMGEIFLIDRKYSHKLREQFISNISKLEYVKKNTHYKGLAMYEVTNYKSVSNESQKNIKEQKWVDIGIFISFATVIICIITVIKGK